METENVKQAANTTAERAAGEADRRKPYRKPTRTTHGDVAELTLGGSNRSSDCPSQFVWNGYTIHR